MATNRKSSRSGPVGRSCITCRRRCKKCDKTRPVCERCTIGGFDCLGYDNVEAKAANSDLEKYTGVFRVTKESCGRSAASRKLSFQASRKSTTSSYADIGSSSSTLPDVLGPEFLYECHRLAHSESLSQAPSYDAGTSTLLDLQLSWNMQSPHFVRSTSGSDITESELREFIPPGSLASPSTLNSQSFRELPYPRTLFAVSYNTRYIADFIVSQYERLSKFSYFRSNDLQVVQLRASVARRMQGSDSLRWIMFLAMKTLSAVLDSDGTANLDRYMQWINKFEQNMDHIVKQQVNLGNLSDFTGILELTFVKLKFMHILNTYQHLQNLAPIVLQILYTDPTLWLGSGDFTSVSLNHILASSRHELIHFVLIDSLCSLAYVLPHAIEYDTSVAPFDIDMHPTEWIHGCPVDFQHALVEINIRCSSRYRTRPERDWQSIELRIKSWQPKIWSTSDEDPQRTVARLAVQESWRHTLLIYLYMSVCGVASDDQRVHDSVRQVFKLVNTLKGSPLVSVYLPIQCIVAGACARTESHRRTAMDRLEDTLKDPIWLLNAANFIPVLDHLWHGAAAGGRPIRWSDYARSRQIALPIAPESTYSM